jgi:transglutaminase-like putative cysteine protease
VRFGLIHRIMTDALAVLGLLALVTSDQLDRWVGAAILIGLAAALTVPERWQDKRPLKQLGVIAPVALLATQGLRLMFGVGLLELAVEFAAGLQVIRLATRRGAAHDQQVIVLSLLHLIAGTVLGSGLAYGLCFVGFLIVAPGALVLSHLRREVEGNYRQGARDRTGLPVDVPRILRSRRVIGRQFLLFTCLLSVPIFLFTAVLFVLFPRVGLSLLLLNHARPERMIGFSDKVDLGGVGKLRSDPTIAMRVEYPGLPGEPPARLALYLRGTAFDQYDGRAWSRSTTQRAPVDRQGMHIRLRRYPDPVRDRRMRIDLEPIEPPVLFLPADAVALTLVTGAAPLLGAAPAIVAGPEGELKYSSTEDRGIRYDVSLAGASEPPVRRLSSAERARYLTLPRDLPGRVRDKARAWAGPADDPLIRSRNIEQRLRTEYRYDLESPSGAAKNPLDHFLFDSKRGHCEFYSTAMAVMLRTLGIPSRNVTGFIGGTYNRFGRYYAVRQGDAHSWVEAYIEDKGWQRFDPTPPANAAPQSEITGVLAFVRDFVEAAAQRWNRHVVGYDLRQQVHLFRSVRTGYSRFTGSSDVFRTAASPRRVAILLAGVALIGVSVYLLRRFRPKRPDGSSPAAQPNARALQIIDLYRALEGALAARGVPRPAGTPPLAHARTLVALSHPVASEALALTQRYLDGRFGGRELSDSERRDFARRVRALRVGREPEAVDSPRAMTPPQAA